MINKRIESHIASNRCMKMVDYINKGLTYMSTSMIGFSSTAIKTALTGGYIAQAAGLRDFGMRPFKSLERAYDVVGKLRTAYLYKLPKQSGVGIPAINKAADVFDMIYRSVVKSANVANISTAQRSWQYWVGSGIVLSALKNSMGQMKESFVLFVAAEKNSNNTEWKRDAKKTIASLNFLQTVLLMKSLLVIGITLFTGGMRSKELIDASSLIAISNWWHDMSRLVLNRYLVLNKDNKAKNAKELICY